MSFAPSKIKSLPRGGNGQDRFDASGRSEDNKHGNDDRSQHSQSIRSQREDGSKDRLTQMGDEIARLQQQQDSYADLLSMKQVITQIQKDQRSLFSLAQRVSNIENRLDSFEDRFDEYQSKTEKFLVVLDRNIDEESRIREDENKRLKKVCTELEGRQKEMDYEIKLDIRNTEIKGKEDMIEATSDIDKKVDAQKEYFTNHITGIHRALKGDVVDNEDRITSIEQKLQDCETNLDNRVKDLESTMRPQLDSANERRKIDYSDLKAWLLDSIDERLKNKEKVLEQTVKKNYKSTVLQQKNEISTLKREITAISNASPVGGRMSHIVNEEKFESNEQPFEEPIEEGNMETSSRKSKKGKF